MNNFSKITLFVAVVGTVGILHAMVDILATPGTKSSIQITQQEDETRQITLTNEVASQKEIAPQIDAELSPSQIVKNIYNTDSGSFYFITIPQEEESFNSQSTDNTNIQRLTTPVYYQAQTLNSDFDVSITGPIVRTRLTQTFENNSGVWQDGVYVFPVPAGAAVDSLTMRVGGREIIGEIQPKKKAKQMFEQAKVAGKKASLVQQVRPDIFKNQLSNIPPNEEIVIEIEYQQLLKYSDAGYELRLPTGINEKYSPAGHDAAEIKDASLPILHPTEIEIELNMGFPLENIESLHHPIETQQFNSAEYYLKTTEKSLKEASFVLRWRLQESEHTQMSHIQESSRNGTFGMVSMLAPTHSDLQLKRDITFILDTSGSMVGDAIEQAKAAIKVAIQDLSYADRFNIVEFDSRASALWGVSNVASDANKVIAIEYLEDLQADGGTEMLGALDLAFELKSYRQREEDRIQQFIFITDGSVANEAEVLTEIRSNIESTRLFTIGIGNAPNGYFMQEAAIAGKGLPLFIGDIDHVDAEMQRFLSKIKQPVWTDLSVNAIQNSGAITFFPKKLPDLYAGEPFYLFYQADTDSNIIHTDTIEVAAKSAVAAEYGGIVLKDIKRQLAPSSVSDGVSISKQWAHEKIQQLMRKLHTTPHRGEDYISLEDFVRQEVTELALAHSLVTKYTSLIAIDHDVEETLMRRLNSAQKLGIGHLSHVDMRHLPSTSADILSARIKGLVLLLIAGISYIFIYRSRIFQPVSSRHNKEALK